LGRTRGTSIHPSEVLLTSLLEQCAELVDERSDWQDFDAVF
jgi:hypothetical protein